MRVFVVIFISLWSLSAFSKNLKVAFRENRPPYIFEEKGQLKGIEFDVVREALLTRGYEIDYIKLPTKRVPFAIEKMGYDIAVGDTLNNQKYFYSDEYIEFKNFAMAKTIKNLKLEKIEDLGSHSVGAWPLAWTQCGDIYKKLFAPKQDGSYPPNYYEPLTSETQSKMFWLNRFDIAISNKVTFTYYQKNLGSAYNTDADITYYDIFPDKVKYFVAFKDQKIRDEFNSGLAQLRRNKRYKRIFDTYIQ